MIVNKTNQKLTLNTTTSNHGKYSTAPPSTIPAGETVNVQMQSESSVPIVGGTEGACQYYCIDGDGAVLMHLGSVGIIGDISPVNFKHIIINNGSHDSVGGQPTVGFDINFKKIFKGLNYKNSFKITNSKEFQSIFNEFKDSEGPSVLEILVNKGARKDLGRPTISPSENKIDFMNFLR